MPCALATGGIADAALIPCLDELWQRRIVREQGHGRYDFSHDKIRETAYTAMSEARRRLLHRHIAQALEAVHAGALDAVSGQIGRHFELAGLTAPAIDWYCRAAEAGQRVDDAKADAIGHHRRAVWRCWATRRVRIGKSRADLEKLGDVLHLTAEYGPAREAYQDAAGALRRHRHGCTRRPPAQAGQYLARRARRYCGAPELRRRVAVPGRATPDDASRDLVWKWASVVGGGRGLSSN